MRSPLDLSIRYKMPLWGGILILITALAVSLSLIRGEYDELRDDLTLDAAILSDSVKAGLASAILKNDVWAAYEIIEAPLAAEHPTDIDAIHPEDIFVLDNSLRVFVAANPKVLPLDADLRQGDPLYAALAKQIDRRDRSADQAIDMSEYGKIYYAWPISHRGETLGLLVIGYPDSEFMSRFIHFAWRGGLVAAIILAVLLPINWYWGQYLARPLVELANRMEQIGKESSHDAELPVPAHKDELGRLVEVFNAMLRELKAKELLEAEMVRSERLTAVGRLAAGVAHEINNPLSGMLTAIDTLRHHGEVSPMILKTLGLVERGLNQIKDIVAALLVQARMKGRNLTPEDVEDVYTLVKPQAKKKRLRVEWNNRLPPEVPLPATLVRQVLINLMLNAVQAAAEEGDVAIDIATADGKLQLRVANNGKALSPDEQAHIFEPFSPVSREGHGLGLWVTYQIVQQLNGEIRVASIGDRTVFSLTTPLGGIG